MTPRYIQTLAEIDSPGTYLSATLPDTLPCITIDEDDEGFYVAVAGQWVMNGWNIKRWKTFKGCKLAIQDWATRGEQGMYLWTEYGSRVV